MSKVVGVGVLVSDTGETPRTIQHWSDLGILKPLPSTDKRGRGVHREFNASLPFHGERTWALIASALNRYHLPLGDVRAIIDSLRYIAAAETELPPERWEVRLGMSPIGRALLGRLEAGLIVLNEDGTAGWCNLLKKAPTEEQATPDIYPAGYVNNDEDWKVYRDIDLSAPYDFIANYEAGLFLNFTKILAPLRDQQASEA